MDMIIKANCGKAGLLQCRRHLGIDLWRVGRGNTRLVVDQFPVAVFQAENIRCNQHARLKVFMAYDVADISVLIRLGVADPHQG